MIRFLCSPTPRSSVWLDGSPPPVREFGRHGDFGHGHRDRDVATVVVSLVCTGERQARARWSCGTELAVDAVRKFHEAVTDNLDVRNRPDLSGLRKKLLAEPLKFFQQLRRDLQTGANSSPALPEARQSEPWSCVDRTSIGSKADGVRVVSRCDGNARALESMNCALGSRPPGRGRPPLPMPWGNSA